MSVLPLLDSIWPVLDVCCLLSVVCCLLSVVWCLFYLYLMLVESSAKPLAALEMSVSTTGFTSFAFKRYSNENNVNVAWNWGACGVYYNLTRQIQVFVYSMSLIYNNSGPVNSLSCYGLLPRNEHWLIDWDTNTRLYYHPTWQMLQAFLCLSLSLSFDPQPALKKGKNDKKFN